MTSGRGKFEEDLNSLLARLIVDLTAEQNNRLTKVKDHLIELQKLNVVKINHSVMELVCSKYLVLKGYDVQVEYPLDPILTCDLYTTKASYPPNTQWTP
jgi:hypothetical protein